MSESPNELKDMAGMRNRIETAMKRKSYCNYLHVNLADKNALHKIINAILFILYEITSYQAY